MSVRPPMPKAACPRTAFVAAASHPDRFPSRMSARRVCATCLRRAQSPTPATALPPAAHSHRQNTDPRPFRPADRLRACHRGWDRRPRRRSRSGARSQVCAAAPASWRLSTLRPDAPLARRPGTLKSCRRQLQPRHLGQSQASTALPQPTMAARCPRPARHCTARTVGTGHGEMQPENGPQTNNQPPRTNGQRIVYGNPRAARHNMPMVEMPRWVLPATILGSSLSFIDGSVVNVALPAMQRDFRADLATMQLIVNGYMLMLASLILLGGSVGDRFGRRRIFLIGLCCFAGASLACGLAPAVDWLITARFVQGCAAALLVPASLAMIGSAYTGEARGRAIGTWAGAAALTTALGPPLGGWLIDSISWRAIFLINLPIAAL